MKHDAAHDAIKSFSDLLAEGMDAAGIKEVPKVLFNEVEKDKKYRIGWIQFKHIYSFDEEVSLIGSMLSFSRDTETAAYMVSDIQERMKRDGFVGIAGTDDITEGAGEGLEQFMSNGLLAAGFNVQAEEYKSMVAEIYGWTICAIVMESGVIVGFAEVKKAK